MTKAGWRSAALLLVTTLAGCDAPAHVDAGPADVARVVTLSPHLAELVFAVGAGDRLVGVSAYTDFPAPAASLPVIGDAYNIDQERLALLEPDLLLAWDTGTPQHVVDELRERGYRIRVITTTSLDDVPVALSTVGELLQKPDKGNALADEFRRFFADLSAEYRDAPEISVFYQVDARPLYTINGGHFLSALIDSCGGRNIFEHLDGLAPLVSVEAVLDHDPEVILASSDAGPSAFDEWDRWPGMAANRFGNRFLMPADQIARPTPRLQVAARAVCDVLDQARSHRRELAGGE